MATTFRPRRLSAENTAENRDHEFGALKTQWSAAARKSARMPFGALDPNSSVSYPGGAGVKKSRKAARKPFVKPPPLDAELLVGADPLPGLRSPGKAPPRRASLAPAACARTPNVARAAPSPAAPTPLTAAMLAAPTPVAAPTPKAASPASCVSTPAEASPVEKAPTAAPTPVAPSPIQKAPTPAPSPVAEPSPIRKIEKRQSTPIEKAPTLSPHKPTAADIAAADATLARMEAELAAQIRKAASHRSAGVLGGAVKRPAF